jgi:hypothetical protein
VTHSYASLTPLCKPWLTIPLLPQPLPKHATQLPFIHTHHFRKIWSNAPFNYLLSRPKQQQVEKQQNLQSQRTLTCHKQPNYSITYLHMQYRTNSFWNHSENSDPSLSKELTWSYTTTTPSSPNKNCMQILKQTNPILFRYQKTHYKYLPSQLNQASNQLKFVEQI